MDEEQIQEIIDSVAANFRTFGGGRKSEWNPIANAIADAPPQFAAGVNVEAVVRHIIARIEFPSTLES